MRMPRESLDDLIDRIAADLTVVPADSELSVRLQSQLQQRSSAASGPLVAAAAAAAVVLIISAAGLLPGPYDGDPSPRRLASVGGDVRLQTPRALANEPPVVVGEPAARTRVAQVVERRRVLAPPPAEEDASIAPLGIAALEVTPLQEPERPAIESLQIAPLEVPALPTTMDMKEMR